jgi:hypothetical protein
MRLLMSAFGTKRTSQRAYPMSVFGGKADIGRRMYAVPSGFLFRRRGRDCQ